MIWNKGFHNALDVHSSMNPVARLQVRPPDKLYPMYVKVHISLHTTISRPALGIIQAPTQRDWGLFPYGLRMNGDKPSVPPYMELLQ